MDWADQRAIPPCTGKGDRSRRSRRTDDRAGPPIRLSATADPDPDRPPNMGRGPLLLDPAARTVARLDASPPRPIDSTRATPAPAYGPPIPRLSPESVRTVSTILAWVALPCTRGGVETVLAGRRPRHAHPDSVSGLPTHVYRRPGKEPRSRSKVIDLTVRTRAVLGDAAITHVVRVLTRGSNLRPQP
jgi:hypothetical protein